MSKGRRGTTFSSLECYSGRFPPGLPHVSTVSKRDRRTKSSFATPISDFALGPKSGKALNPAFSSVLKPIQAFPLPNSDNVIEERFKAAIDEASNGNLQAAITAYEAILASEPTHIPSRLNLGVVLMKLGRVIEAVEVFSEGLAGDADPRLQYNLAICCILRKELKTASELLVLAANTDSEALKSQVLAAQSHIQSLQPRVLPISTSQPDLQSSPIANRPKTRSCYYCSDSSPARSTSRLAGSSTEKALIVPKSALWKAFKSIEEYDPRGSTRRGTRIPTPTVYHVRTKSAKNRPSSHTVPTSTPAPFKRPSPIKIHPRKSEESVISSEGNGSPMGGGELRKQRPLQRIKKQGSFMQEDLEDEEKLRTLQFDVDQEEQVRKKFAEVSAVVQKEADKLSSSTDLIEDVQLEKTINGRLTQQALLAIRHIFSSEPSEANQKRLLSILSPLKFFSRFQPEVCLRLFDISKHQHFPPGELIFSQGETGDLMFVILYGSVILQKQASDLGEKPLTIGTLYDGDCFGESSVLLMQAKKGNTARAFSCVAGEPCDLLALPKLAYQMIIMQQVETTIEGKLAFFASLPIFEGFQRVSLVPLATNIEPKLFKFNQIIIRKGDRPSGLHIIMKGLCKVYSEGQFLPQVDKEAYASSRVRQIPALRAFHIGKNLFSKVGKAQWSLGNEQISRFDLGKSHKVQSFALDQREKSQKVLLATLQKGDFFGGRSVLGDESLKRPEEEVPIEPAKCTIVAESAEVAILVVSKQQLQYLGEKLAVICRQEQVKERLAKISDSDCPQNVTKEALSTDIKQWGRYKTDLLDHTYRSLFVHRHQQTIISALRDH